MEVLPKRLELWEALNQEKCPCPRLGSWEGRLFPLSQAWEMECLGMEERVFTLFPQPFWHPQLWLLNPG